MLNDNNLLESAKSFLENPSWYIYDEADEKHKLRFNESLALTLIGRLIKMVEDLEKDDDNATN